MEETQKPAEEAKPAATSVDNTKLIAAIGYVPFLCFFPLMSRATDEFLAFHGRQGLLLTILCVIMSILSPVIGMAIPLIGFLVISVINLGLLVLMIVAALKAYNGEKWVLPGIGQFADKLKF